MGMMKQHTRSLFALLLMLLLAACGSNTATDTPGEMPELAQTFQESDLFGGNLIFNYPEGWFQNNDGDGAIITNREALLNDISQELQSGDIVISVVSVPYFVAASLTGNPDEEPTASQLLGVFMGELTESSDAAFGDPQTLTIDGHDAVRVTGSDSQGEVAAYMLNAGDYFVNIIGITPENELEANLPLFEAVAASVDYSIPETPATEDVSADDIVPEEIEVTAEATADTPAATEEP